MKLADLDESVTLLPIDAVREAVGAGHELAVIPARDQERGTACLLIARTGQLWIAWRTQGTDPGGPPDVTTEPVEWHRVGIGPMGSAGRVPGGFLGGPDATDHYLTVVAGDHLFEVRMPRERGMLAVEEFASVALHAGARDYDP